MLDTRLEPAVARDMVKGAADPLYSAFHLGYNMLLNILRVRCAPCPATPCVNMWYAYLDVVHCKSLVVPDWHTNLRVSARQSSSRLLAEPRGHGSNHCKPHPHTIVTCPP